VIYIIINLKLVNKTARVIA